MREGECVAKVPTTARDLLSFRGRTACLLALACMLGAAVPAPSAEFDSPYELRVLSDGAVLEVSGSFSWALPQALQAVLASTPEVRVVQFESPGGHVKPALEVAEVIRRRGLDTYVGRFCASACTVAFLGGRQRWVAPDGRLGFHQAHGPGVPAAQASAFLRDAYEKFSVPRQFIAHVLNTPPENLWFPTPVELRAAGFTTGASPNMVATPDDSGFRRLQEVTSSLRAASDAAVIQFAAALADVFEQLQGVSAESCWAFAHDLPIDLTGSLRSPVLEALSAAARRIAQEARTTPPTSLDAGQRQAAIVDLTESMRAKGQNAALDSLRMPVDHAAFCASLRVLLEAALALPEDRRARGLRVVLSGG